jgi:hypothetical protein
MLVALLHFSVATHYCMGRVAASKISLSGELATCGMENDENIQTQADIHFTSHCCDNTLIFCGIHGNYFPSYSFVPESYNDNFQVFSTAVSLTTGSISCFQSINATTSPPGVSASNNVDLSVICVLRI